MHHSTAARELSSDKRQQHWDDVAEGWARWLEWIERNFAPVTDWLEIAAAWHSSTRMLDVACGAGYPALTAAARMRDGGTIVATDISPAMVAATSCRSRERGLQNLHCREMDAELVDFPPASFDVVCNTYGLMLLPDPVRAVAEAHRVLEPGGRLAVVAWDEPAKSPYFTVMAGVATAFLSLPSNPSGPGPFSLAPPGKLESVLRSGGFTDVRIESRSMTVECESVRQYCQIFADVAWKARFAALSEADLVRFVAAVEDAAQPYVVDGRLRLAATSLCALARKS